MILLLIKLNPLYSRILRLVEVGPLVLEKILQMMSNVFSHFFSYFPFGEWNDPSFDKHEFLSSSDALCQVSVKLTLGFWIRSFSISSIIFSYFVIIFPWKGRGPFFFNNWSPWPKVALYQVLLKLTMCSWRRRWKCGKIPDG